jgi:carboxymethylenebutenolidase
MRKTLGIWAAALLLSLAARAAGAGVKASDVTLKSGDEEIKAFLAEPDGPGPFPGIVVIQEWWGLNDWIKENAKRLAAQGYVALAPDLYRGKVTDDPRVAGELLKGMPRDRAVRDLKAAVSDLAGRKNVRKDAIGSIGWCMGGGYSLQLALNDDRVKACVMCYGAVETNPEKLKSFNATLLGVFGEEDRGIPAASVRQFEEALKKDGKKVEHVHLYKAGHGFMRPNNGPDKPNPAYREAEAKDAWQRIDAFFAKTLAGK